MNNMNDNINAIFGSCFGVIILIMLAIAFGGWVFMALWNWASPLFWATGPILKYWESCAIVLLIIWISFIFKHQPK